jgi:hypothetical protein
MGASYMAPGKFSTFFYRKVKPFSPYGSVFLAKKWSKKGQKKVKKWSKNVKKRQKMVKNDQKRVKNPKKHPFLGGTQPGPKNDPKICPAPYGDF